MEYCCDKCSLQGSFRTVIEHFIADHPLHNLGISRRILNHLTAKMARQSDFAIVPQDITKSGGKLVIDDVSKKVRVTSNSQPHGFHNTEQQTNNSNFHSDLASNVCSLNPSVC